ncbi:MAG: NTP transferase domain-containing protein [Rhodospirillales bacterium]|nr:NTP transferase domain-containing protein [Rhodospirillales bacterium]
MTLAPRTGAVIFARLDSRRLPEKALREVAGRPLLGRVIDRVRQIRNIGRVILATSDRAVDDRLQSFASKEGVEVFRGDADSTLNRAVACARRFSLDVILRVCGDSPFLLPEVAEELIRVVEEKNFDLATNVSPRTFPVGMSAEAIRTQALEIAQESADSAECHEHCTRYFYLHPGRFNIYSLTRGTNLSSMNFAVDTPADLERASQLCQLLGNRVDVAGLPEILATAARLDGAKADS